MPHTVNGIGTWYYGKDNVVTRNDRCEFCGNYGELKSYDTTLYFVVVFIPLIPMGRKRIIDQCPACRRHRAAKLSEWEKRKGDVILEKTQAWQADRGNKEKAFAALGATIGFSDRESFDQLAAAVGDAFKRDADAQIFLGDAYDHFGDYATAESSYRAAVTNRPDEASKEALARFFIRRTRPADAAPLLAHIIANRKRDRAGHMLALAETYQAVGDHESAFRIVDDIGTTFPDLLSDPAFERVRRSVAKYRGTNKVVKSAGTGRAGREGAARRTSWLGRNSGLALLGAVLLTAVAIYLSMAVARGKHTVILVNGTSQPYSVDINGQKHSIPAMGHRPIELAEGDFKVSVPERGAMMEPASVAIHTNFWSRPFHQRNFVINPDRLGLVIWQQTMYGDAPANRDQRRPTKMYCGDVLYDLDSVDYVFEEFPHSIPAQDTTKTITKTKIDMVRDAPPLTAVRVVKAQMGAEAAAAWARRFAVSSPDPVVAIMVAANGMTRTQEIEFLHAHLSDRPIRIEWHRRYQSIVQNEQPDHDVLGEYRALLAKDPSDSTLMYLLARLIEDRDEATQLFRRAAAAPTPCPYATYALSNDALVDGDYPRSLEMLRAVRKDDPENLTFKMAEVNVLEALGRAGEARRLVSQLERHQGEDHDVIAVEVRLHVKEGDHPAARTRIDTYCQEINKLGFGDEDVTEIRNLLDSELYYASGDAQACSKALSGLKSAEKRFEAAIVAGAPDEAAKILAQTPDAQTSTSYLVLCLSAQAAGKTATAESAWTGAVTAMKKKGDRHDRILAAALAGNNPPSDAALRNWVAAPQERALVLTALGLRYPQKQQAYFAMARKLNYTNDFPSRTIAQATR